MSATENKRKYVCVVSEGSFSFLESQEHTQEVVSSIFSPLFFTQELGRCGFYA